MYSTTTLLGLAMAIASLVAAQPVTEPFNALVKRQNPNCNIGDYEEAPGGRIKQGISYLESLGSDPVGVAAGPGACSRVSCSYDSAISVCNDNDSALSGVTFSQVVSVAQSIAETCNGNDDNGASFNGQVFMPGGWNVLIDGQAC